MSNQEQLTSETYTWAPDAQGAKDGPGMLPADQSAAPEREQLPIACPHCKGEFHVASMATIPDEQKLIMTIEHSAGPCIAATTLGDTITNTGKLLMAVAEEIGGKTAVMVEKCELVHGKASIHFVILGVKP